MSDLISREALKKEIFDVYEYEYPTASGEFDKFVTRVIPNIINNIPTIDAVEVVRCKDCKYFKEIDSLYGECTRLPNELVIFMKNPSCYCSDGERRKNEN